MAQQQQTVLRVQTNIVDNNIVLPVGEIQVQSATTGFTYVGSGTTLNPYTGSTTGSTSHIFEVKAINTGGIINYSVTGSASTNIIYYNDVLYDSFSGSSSDSININVDDKIKFTTNNTGVTFNFNYNPTTEYVYQNLNLDLYTDIPIKINKSFAEVQDISKRNSDYSIGLQLPGSKKNNRFFEGFFNVDNQTLFFDATKRVPCLVLINDQAYFEGYMRLNKVSVLNSKVEYDVTLFSNIGDLFGKIGNNLLKDLNFDDPDYIFNHTFSRNEVASWDNQNIFELENPPNYFYPVVHNGYEYSGSTPYISGGTVSGQTRLYTSTQPISGFTSAAAGYSAGVKRYRINSYEDGILDTQLKPALNIKSLLELMFKTYGYKIKSDFFNTPWFKLLYMYGYFSSDTTKFSYKFGNTPTFNVANVQIFIVVFNDVVTAYVVQADTGIPCKCDTDLTVSIEFFEYSTFGYVYFDFVIPAGNTTGTYQFALGTYFYTSYNEAGSTVPYSTVVLKYYPLDPGTTVYYEDDDFVDFSVVINDQLKQIDLLSSIAKKFNLVFIQDPDIPNQIIIEPYEYYIGSGNVHNWTDKLSFDKGFSVQPALNFIESELILTDLEDGDYGNKTFKDQNNRIYGQNFVFNPTDFKSQTKRIETIFSPELIRKWDTEATAPNGQIKLPLGINYSLANNSIRDGDNEISVPQYKGTKTKPKLFYYLGAFNYFLDTYNEVIPYSGSYFTNAIYINNSSGTNVGSPNFLGPIVSHTMPIGNPDDNKINNDSISILFNSELPTDIGVETYNVYTENDLYSLFYQTRIENLFNKDTRFLNGHFNLKLSDILNLEPKDLIKINEQYFVVNKISEYNLTNPELTNVELIQVNNTLMEYPSRYFFYYYCDAPSTIYKFKTDMTNPNLRETNYGWSVLYDYNVGILGGNISGYTSTIRDINQGSGYAYVPYYIYEVSATTYNASGITRTSDTFWMDITESGATDLNYIDFPTYCYTSGASTNIVFNLFTSCSDFSTKASSYGIETGSSTIYGPVATPTPTPTATLTPTPTPSSFGMRGQLLITFDEILAVSDTTSVQIFVNNQNRNLIHKPTENLYTTYLYKNDVVKVRINTISTDNSIDINRRDYTTDDRLGQNGIVDTFITGVTGTNISGIFEYIFTATTIASAYDFEYRVEAKAVFPPTPTPTPTVTSTQTLTPTPTPSPTTTNFPQGDYLVVSFNTTTRESINGGINWHPNVSASNIYKPYFFFSKYDYSIAISNLAYSNNTNQAYLSNDQGVTYSLASGIPTGSSIHSAGLSYDGSLQIIVEKDYIYKSTNYGSTWSQIHSISAYTMYNGKSFAMSSDGKYMIQHMKFQPHYLFSNDYGSSWTFNDFGLGVGPLFGVDMSSDGKYIVFGSDSGIFVSSNTGTTFSQNCTGGNCVAGCPAMSDSGQYIYIWGGGLDYSAIILKSSDYGATFTELTGMTANMKGYSNNCQFNLNCSRDGKSIYANVINTGTSEYSTIFSSDYGVSWTEITNNTIGVTSAALGTAFMPNMWHSINLTPTPTPTSTTTPTPTPTKTLTPTPTATITNTPTSTLTPTAGLFGNDGLYVLASSAGDGKIYLSNNYGSSFTQIFSGTYDTNDGCMNQTGDILYFTQYGSYLKKSTNYGATFTDLTSAGIDNWVGIDCDATGQNIVATTANTTKISSDYGVSWTTISNVAGTTVYRNVYMPEVNVFPIYAFMPDVNTYIRTLSSGSTTYSNYTNIPVGNHRILDMSTDGKYILEVSSDQIRLSTDYGSTYNVLSISGLTLLTQMDCAVSAYGDYMTISTDFGQIVSSSDYGQTWSGPVTPNNTYNLSLNDIELSGKGQYRYCCIEANAPEGGAYYSNDYGLTWTQSNGPLKGIPVSWVKTNRKVNLPAPTPTMTPTKGTPTPTPTPTPTSTPTSTLTPTPTATALPITFIATYKMQASSTPSGTKQVNNFYFIFNSVNYNATNFTWTTSANVSQTITSSSFNIGSDSITAGRDLCRQSGASSLTLDKVKLRIIKNSVEIYNNTSDIANVSIQLCPTSDSRTKSSSSITVNYGDTIEVEWTDIFS